MKYLGLFLLFLSTNLMAETVVKDGCVECGKDPLAKGEVEKALGVDPEKIEIPTFQYKGFITIEELNKYDTNTLAEMVVRDIGLGCDEIRGGDAEESIGEYSDLMLFVNDGLIDKIAMSGFQNQHVTVGTKGYSSRIARLNSEISTSGIFPGYNSKAKELLPKYSALNVNRSGHFYKDGYTRAPTVYGNMAVVFKESVKKRTSFSPKDSLQFSRYKHSVSLGSLDYKDNKGKQKDVRCGSSYCEAQIWGELTLDDVAYALIPEDVSVPQSFKERGIPVYRVKKGKKGTVGWEKGPLVFDPNSSEGKKAYIKPKDRVKPFFNCSSCKGIQRRVFTHKMIPEMSIPELRAAIKKERYSSIKREMFAEILSRDISDKDKISIIESEFAKIKKRAGRNSKWRDLKKATTKFFGRAKGYGVDKGKGDIEAPILLQALASFSSSQTNLRKHILWILSDKDEFHGDYNSHLTNAPDYMAVAIALQHPDLKNDKKIQRALLLYFSNIEKSKNVSDPLEELAYSILTGENRCEIPPKNFVRFLKQQFKK